jgi:hypothetical protein
LLQCLLKPEFQKYIYGYNGYLTTSYQVANNQPNTNIEYSQALTPVSVALHKIENYPVAQWNQISRFLDDINGRRETDYGIAISFGTILSKISRNNNNEILDQIKKLIEQNPNDNLSIKFIQFLTNFIYAKVKQIPIQLIQFDRLIPSDSSQINEWIINKILNYEFNGYVYQLKPLSITTRTIHYVI